MGSRNEEKPNALKNHGILTRKDLKGTRELTEHEMDDKWVGRPLGGVGRPHTSSSRAGFSRGGFLSLSNPEKYIFVLRNIRRMAEV